MMSSRKPRSKKALSYAKDRRNTYGQNDKASRKLVAVQKATENRQDRHKVAQDMAMLPVLADEEAELIESSARHDVHRVGGWTKSDGDPLGKIVTWAKNGKVDRFIMCRGGRELHGRRRPASP